MNTTAEVFSAGAKKNNKKTNTIGPLHGLLWLAQRVSALLLVVGLVVHLVAIHLGLAAGLSFRAVSARLALPGWRLFEAAFLVAVTWHALGGLWLIIEDYVPLPQVRRVLFYLLLALGAELLGTGLYSLASIPWAA
ncbi:MAG: succinate dehydrogenase, hydrophobic membrane anchor protein [Pseudomonadota bacterium]